MTVAKLVAIVATAFFFTGALCFDGNDTTAQARLIIIDKLIAKEKMEYARKYFDRVDSVGATICADELEGLSIIRIESAKSCLNAKCLTIVIRACAKEPCPNVKVLADRSAYSNPSYVELFRGLRSITFGNPGSTTGPVVVFGEDLMFVATWP